MQNHHNNQNKYIRVLRNKLRDENLKKIIKNLCYPSLKHHSKFWFKTQQKQTKEETKDFCGF